MSSPIRRLTVSVAAAALLLSAGCAKGPQDRLAGKWVGETIDNVPPDHEARANGWVRGTSFEFKGDKMTVSIPAEEPRTGTYKVDRASGNRLTLQVYRASGEADETALMFMGENTLRWDIGNDRSIKLSRVVAQ
jgi:hypothetical protein